MSAEVAILALLHASPAVTAICEPDSICLGNLPLKALLPGIGVRHISTIPQGAIDAQATHTLVVSRIQVTAVAREYPVLKQVMTTIRQACNYERGVIEGVLVVSILRSSDGPYLIDETAGMHELSTDFLVTFHEPH